MIDAGMGVSVGDFVLPSAGKDDPLYVNDMGEELVQIEQFNEVSGKNESVFIEWRQLLELVERLAPTYGMTKELAA